MGIIAKPFTFSAGATIVAADINSDFDTIYTEFNGNIDNTNIKAGANIDAAKLLASSVVTSRIADLAISEAKLDYASVKLLHAGVTGLKYARGGSAYSFPASAVFTGTVNFSTADDGNPAFAGTPRVVITILHPVVSAVINGVRLTAVSNISFTFRLDASASNSESGTLLWYAVGA